MRAQLEPLGDAALLIRLGDRIESALNSRAVALADALRAARLPGIHDVAPAYASVCVRYDATAWAGASAPACAYELVAAEVGNLVDKMPDDSPGPFSSGEGGGADHGVIQIPVCYGGEFGPDLDAIAAHVHLDPQAVIERHCANEYRVAMLGFMPGFPYLLGLDPTLHAPRRDSPRTRVPPGSVAIGGAQTGIYPRALPGGWQLLGRTPLRLFDPVRAEPALLRPGQCVRFRAIEPDEFAALAQ
jgi:KipI family sensor histidine kinase inhibitor